MQHKWHLSYLVLASALLTACNNYDLKDKLENPGGNAQTEKFADRLFAFVTSAVTKGDMQGLVAGDCGGNGFARADCVCQRLAEQNGRRMNSGSRFVAWLGETNNSMKCRIQNLTGPSCTLPNVNLTWYNTNLQPVFSGILGASAAGTELFNATTTLMAPLNFTESGGQLPPGQFVWTGSGGDGAGNGSHCTAWTLQASLGLYGQADLLSIGWTNLNSQAGNNDAHIYCFAMP